MKRVLAAIALTFGRRTHTRRSIGTTILCAFVAIGVITGALGEYGALVLAAAGDFVTDTYDRTLMAVSYARGASADFSRMETEFLRGSIAPPDLRPTSAEKLDKLTTALHEDLAVVEERSSAADEKELIAGIRDLVDRWSALRSKSGVSDQREKLGQQIIERLDLLTELTADHTFVARRKALSAIQWFTYSSFGVLTLALLLSAAVTVLLIRRIMPPLAAAADAADRIAKGELETPIPAGGEDETGLLLRSMTVMQENIRSMVEREKEQRRSAQSRLVAALESSREAIVLVDADGRIAIANSQLAKFFPTLAPRLQIGMSFAEAFRDLDQMVGEIGNAPAGQEPDQPRDVLCGGIEFCITDGRWLRGSKIATQDGGFFLLISDITDFKERERRLDEARRQAVAASDSKSAFLATMSHELRTPLNAVIGFAEILSAQIFGPLGNARYVEYAENIMHSGKHLLGIINNVLDLSKHQAGKLELALDMLDLSEIVASCATMMHDQCTRAGLTLTTEVSGSLVMTGDAGKLRQMLLNLMSNAAKFTNSGGSVTVTAEALADDRLLLTVADTGIGMSPEQIPIALAVFGQVDSRLARRYDGTGLGLPLAKSIAELHGGDIAIDSVPGQGTRISVFLPRDASDTTAPVEPLLERVA